MPPPIEAYRAQIEAALAQGVGTHNYEDVVAGVNDRSLQFWPGVASVMITEIVNYPRKKVFNVFLAGGLLAEIEIMAPIVAAWGREQGCDVVTLQGRKGWARTFLARDGWKVVNEQVAMENIL